MKNINNELARIANTHLGSETLETRKSDSLDFHDCSVWGIRAALEAAYNAGLAAGKNNAHCLVGKIVKNDGHALTAILGKYEIGDATHDGNFTFSTKMKDGKMARIVTEPIDEEYTEIQILSVSISE